MMDDLRQSKEFEFLNLEGVCQAEENILRDILRSDHSKEYSKGLFCFDTPFSANEEQNANIFLQFGQGEGEDPSIAGSVGSGNVSVVSVSTGLTDVSTQATNGSLVMALSPQQQQAIVSQQGPVPHGMSYYPSQTHMTVSVSGAGALGPSLGPNSVHNPGSGNQMVMFTQQPLPQMIQTPGGYYPHPHHGYYGPPQQGGQPHMSYVTPGSEPMSPDSNYAPQSGQIHQKSHHDPHHSIHSTNSSGQGSQNSYNKKRRPQNQQYFYHTGFISPYYNQQMAQNVTGSPIIMTAPPNMYHYPPPHHPSMYNQGPQGNELEHHPGNLGVPPQSMNSIPNEMGFAQHQAGPNTYTQNSPTHSNTRMGFNPSHSIPSNRVTGALPQSDLPTVADQLPDISVGEKPISNLETPCPASENLIKSSQLPNGSVVSNKEIVKDSSSAAETTDSHKVIKSRSENIPLPTLPLVNGDMNASASCNLESTANNAISSPPMEQTPIETRGEGFKEVSLKPNHKDLKSVPRKPVLHADNIKEPSVLEKPLSVNGDLEGSCSSDKLLLKNRDKLSADHPSSSVNVVKRDHEKFNHAKTSEGREKFKVSNNNSSSIRKVSANSSSTSPTNGGVKDEHKVEEGSSGEFPNLATVPNASDASQTSSAAQPKSRSWASIASVKTQNIPNDGATLRTLVTHNLHSNVLEEQTVMSSAFPSLSNSGCKSNDVPIMCGEKSGGKYTNADLGFDSARLSDESDPVAIRLGEHLQQYVLDHQSIPLGPRGLCNQSNYCFLNATLQALLSCPTFVNMFRAMAYILGRTPCKATPIIQSVFEFVSEFVPLLRGNTNKKDRMRDAFSVGPNLEPTGIRKCLGLLEGESFKVEGRQEDAEEFLSHLLNGLHDEMIKVIKWYENKKEKMEKGSQPLPVPHAEVNGRSEEVNEEEDDDQWQVMGAKNKSCLTRKTNITKSPISEAFLGQMCSSLSRVNSLKSATLQPFYTLQLDIQNDNIRSVRDALEAISTREEVSGVTSASGSEVEAYRQLSLEELPPVLILHSKRFVYEKNGNRIHKIDKKLDFGVDLEIGKDLLSNNSKGRYGLKQRQYKLFAVVYHDGEEAHKGHYVADCFHTSGGSMWGQWGWLRYDDTTVKPVPEAQMLNPVPPRVPYLLYYRRVDTIQQQQTKKERS